MAWSLTQSKANTTGASNLNVVFDGTPVKGTLLLASVADNSTTNTPTVSDSNGNWTLLASKTRTNNGLYLFGLIAAASQPTTINVVRSTDTMQMAIYEFAGGARSVTGIVDQTAGITADGVNTTNTAQPSITTLAGNELVFTQLLTTGAVTSPTLSDGTFTAGKTAPSAIQLVDYYKLNAAAATYNPSFSWTTSRNCAQLTTSLKTASSGFFALL